MWLSNVVINRRGLPMRRLMRRADRPHVVKAVARILQRGAFDLSWSETYPIALLQHLVGGDRLAVDADQVVLRSAMGDLLGEELLHTGAGGDVNIVSKPRAIVVNAKYLHRLDLLVEGKWKERRTTATARLGRSHFRPATTVALTAPEPATQKVELRGIMEPDQIIGWVLERTDLPLWESLQVRENCCYLEPVMAHPGQWI
jgi:hypothetical protein